MFDFTLYRRLSSDLKDLKLANYQPENNTFNLEYIIQLPVINKEIRNHQELKFNHDEYTIEFEQIDGPLKFYKGIRKLVQKGNGTEFSIEAVFQLTKSQAIMTGLVKPIFEKSLHSVVQGIRLEAEARINLPASIENAEKMKQEIHRMISNQAASL